MINARAETVDKKPAYRNAFRHRRCLIPSEGFYEWKADKGKMTPFLIRRAGYRSSASVTSVTAGRAVRSLAAVRSLVRVGDRLFPTHCGLMSRLRRKRVAVLASPHGDG